MHSPEEPAWSAATSAEIIADVQKFKRRMEEVPHGMVDAFHDEEHYDPIAAAARSMRELGAAMKKPTDKVYPTSRSQFKKRGRK